MKSDTGVRKFECPGVDCPAGRALPPDAGAGAGAGTGANADAIKAPPAKAKSPKREKADSKASKSGANN